MEPCIAYIRLHHFYAFLEIHSRPHLKGLPFVVTEGGKIVDVSPEAAALNIHSQMGLRQAYLACPNLKTITRETDPTSALEKFLNICASITPYVEPHGDFAAFLDLKGLGERSSTIANVLKVFQAQLNFPWFMGIATNKLVAKIACQGLQYSKANKERLNYLVVEPGTEKGFLAPLSTGHLWPWPEKIHTTLASLGIYTIGQLAEVPLRQLENQLGETGKALYDGAKGIDRSAVQGLYPRKTIQGHFHLPPETGGCRDLRSLEQYLLPLLQDAATELRVKGQACTKIRLMVLSESKENRFELDLKDEAQFPEELHKAIRRFLEKDPWPGPIFGIRFMLMGLKPKTLEQTSFASQIMNVQKSTKLGEILTTMQSKFGSKSIFLAKDIPIPRRERMLQFFYE